MEVVAEEPVDETQALAAPAMRGGLSQSAARLFRVYRTIATLLDKRGYMVPKAIRKSHQQNSRIGLVNIRPETLSQFSWKSRTTRATNSLCSFRKMKSGSQTD